MKNSKNIIIAILLVIVIVLVYMLTVSFPNKAKAECEAGVAATIGQITDAAQQCQQTLTQLMQIPACASALGQ